MADENIKIGIDVSQVVSGAKQGADAIKQMGEDAKQSGKAIKDAMDVANMSFGEMRRELRSLNQMSFSGLKPEEIRKIKDRIAELTEGIRDFREQTRTASESGIPGMIAGLRGIVSMAQAVTSTLSLFGVENEKLEKSMIQLIGAAQALATVEDLYAKKTLQVAVAQARKTVTTIADTIATKANTLAAQTNITALKSLFAVMAANPMLVVAAAATALAFAIYKIATSADAVDKAMGDFNKAQEEANKNIGKELATLAVYQKKLNDANLTQAERIRLVNELDEKYPGYLTKAEKEAAIAGQSAVNFDKLATAIHKKALAQAMESKIAENYSKIADLQLEQNDLLNKSTKSMEEQLATIGSPIQRIQQEIDELTLRSRAFTTVIAAQENQIDGYNKALGDAGGGLGKMKDAVKDMAKATKETKKNTEEIFDPLLKYELMVKKIGESYESLYKHQNVIKPVEFEQEGELQTTDELQTQLSARYALEQDHYAKLEFLYKTNQISFEEYLYRNNELAISLEKDQLKKLEFLYKTKQITFEEYEQKKTEIFIKNLQDKLSMSSEILSNIGTITDNLAEAEMNRFKADQEAQTQLLEEEYEKRLASAGANAFKKNQVDKWYSGEKERLEKETTDKSLEIEKKYRRQQQAIQVSQAIASAAQGILGAWVQASLTYPPPASAIIAGIQSALIAGVAATQIGVITSQKYEKGGTGVIEGKSHVSGGVKFFGGEAESDERWAIFNREATLRNTGLADLIDAVNGHQLIIDNNFMKRLNGDANNIVVMSNFNGGEHLAGMHEIMKRNEGRDIYLPDGRIKRGIIKRRYN